MSAVRCQKLNKNGKNNGAPVTMRVNKSGNNAAAAPVAEAPVAEAPVAKEKADMAQAATEIAAPAATIAGFTADSPMADVNAAVTEFNAVLKKYPVFNAGSGGMTLTALTDMSGLKALQDAAAQVVQRITQSGGKRRIKHSKTHKNHGKTCVKCHKTHKNHGKICAKCQKTRKNHGKTCVKCHKMHKSHRKTCAKCM